MKDGYRKEGKGFKPYVVVGGGSGRSAGIGVSENCGTHMRAFIPIWWLPAPFTDGCYFAGSLVKVIRLADQQTKRGNIVYKYDVECVCMYVNLRARIKYLLLTVINLLSYYLNGGVFEVNYSFSI